MAAWAKSLTSIVLVGGGCTLALAALPVRAETFTIDGSDGISFEAEPLASFTPWSTPNQ